MTGIITSPVQGESRTITPAHSVRGEWREFLRFLKRPTLPQQTATLGHAVRGTARMWALDLIIMSVIVGTLMAIVAAGVELPQNLNAELELNLTTIALIVIVAPVLEELAFRSWLSGKPGWLVAIGLLLMAGGVAGAIGVTTTGETAQAGVALSLFVGLFLAVIAMIALRKRPAPDWFRTVFPGFFWGSAICFGLIHVLNYPEEGVFWMVLPLVIPQFVLGTILGYVRVHYGLWTAMALHAAHNGFAISLAALAMESGAA